MDAGDTLDPTFSKSMNSALRRLRHMPVPPFLPTTKGAACVLARCSRRGFLCHNEARSLPSPVFECTPRFAPLHLGSVRGNLIQERRYSVDCGAHVEGSDYRLARGVRKDKLTFDPTSPAEARRNSLSRRRLPAGDMPLSSIEQRTLRTKTVA